MGSLIKKDTPDRSKINDYSHMVADGKSFKAAIMAGLKLSAFGEALVKKADSDADTKAKTDDYQSNHFWNHDPTTATGHKFDYKQEAPAAAPGAGR